jgi:flagellar basal-body rod protein FlgB
MGGLLGSTGALLERYMDLLAARQRVTAGNIANADTPGYQTRDIDFRAELQSYLYGSASPQASSTASSQALAYPAVLVRESFGDGAKNDGNNVDLDREMQKLAENTLRFTTASTLMQKQIQEVRSAIHEGK